VTGRGCRSERIVLGGLQETILASTRELGGFDPPPGGGKHRPYDVVAVQGNYSVIPSATEGPLPKRCPANQTRGRRNLYPPSPFRQAEGQAPNLSWRERGAAETSEVAAGQWKFTQSAMGVLPYAPQPFCLRPLVFPGAEGTSWEALVCEFVEGCFVYFYAEAGGVGELDVAAGLDEG